jgi:hypothetical protein
LIATTSGKELAGRAPCKSSATSFQTAFLIASSTFRLVQTFVSNSLAIWPESEALPPLPQISRLHSLRKEFVIRSQAYLMSFSQGANEEYLSRRPIASGI